MADDNESAAHLYQRYQTKLGADRYWSTTGQHYDVNRLLFSSDAVLNRCENCGINGGLFGSIPVSMQALSDENGRLAPDKRAPWLFLRHIRAPIGAY
jgi:hypothetical protein